MSTRLIKRIGITELTRHASKIFDYVEQHGVVEITKTGKRDGIYVLSEFEYRSILETIDIMNNKYELSKIRDGKCEPVDSLQSFDDVMAEVREEYKKSHEV